MTCFGRWYVLAGIAPLAPSAPSGLYTFLNLACSARRATAGAFDRCASATHTSGPPGGYAVSGGYAVAGVRRRVRMRLGPAAEPADALLVPRSLSASSGFEPATFASPSESLSPSSSSVAARANAACLAAICAIAAL